MEITKFVAGAYTQQYRYKSFSPNRINHNWTWSDQKTHILLEQANLSLGELNAFSLHVPDVAMFIQMHVVKEATTSSRIEGTRTGIKDALLKKQDVNLEKRDDWEEVRNYIKAMNYSIKRLRNVPLSTRLLRETHRILMTGARGRTKSPGEYRTSQNWIGGATLNDAVFVPPHHEQVSTLMGDLENFLQNRTIDVPHLIRIAIAHYQFETIHPFLDGNGRIGRLLIPLYLVSEGVLAKPTLYISEFFEKHKGLYYENLMKARDASDLLHWVKFFLLAATETSKNGVKTLKAILRLKERIERERIVTLGKRAQRGLQLMDLLYKNPSVTASDVEKALSVTPKTANSLISEFARLGILIESTGGKRNRVFIFGEYLSLFAAPDEG